VLQAYLIGKMSMPWAPFWKIADSVFIPSLQRVFEITPLVPRYPSLDGNLTERHEHKGDFKDW
jgi:hypothetical protein